MSLMLGIAVPHGALLALVLLWYWRQGAFVRVQRAVKPKTTEPFHAA